MIFFVFTDIENSTELWRQNEREMCTMLDWHDALLETQLPLFNGRMVKHTGDGIFAVFKEGDPLGFAMMIQRLLSRKGAKVGWPLSIRVAIHRGVPWERHNDYFGLAVSQTAKLLKLCAGGQTLISSDAAAALQPSLILKSPRLQWQARFRYQAILRQLQPQEVCYLPSKGTQAKRPYVPHHTPAIQKMLPNLV